VEPPSVQQAAKRLDRSVGSSFFNLFLGLRVWPPSVWPPSVVSREIVAYRGDSSLRESASQLTTPSRFAKEEEYTCLTLGARPSVTSAFR
jgi:hypothetical protein